MTITQRRDNQLEGVNNKQTQESCLHLTMARIRRHLLIVVGCFVGHVIGKTAPNCCPLSSFQRLIYDYDKAFFLEGSFEDNELDEAMPAGTCPLVSGHPGTPVCQAFSREDGLSAQLFFNDALCPLLSHANYSFSQGRFECVAYTKASFACDRSGTPLCRYQDITDSVPKAPAKSLCFSTESGDALECSEYTAPPDGTCPPSTIDENFVPMNLAAAVCRQLNFQTIPTIYAELLNGPTCLYKGSAMDASIINQTAGCYVVKPKRATGCDNDTAKCYYALLRADSYN